MIPAVSPVFAFWCPIPSRPNFGDALTPWLIRQISGRYARFVPPWDPRTKFFVTGSIISLATANCTVWGSGIMNDHDPVSLKARLIAVRGPLTRRRALACGAECPEVYGDPALLLPRLLPPGSSPRRGPSLIGHFSDLPRLKGRTPPELRLIDIQASVEDIVAQICRSEWLISSSLHGLIVSHAYGVPAAWIKFRDLPSGDDSKFRDYYASLGVAAPEPVRITDDCAGFAAIERKAWCPARIHTDGLWRTCPFPGASGREIEIGDGH